jgi:fatty acid-binding protein DegV
MHDSVVSSVTRVRTTHRAFDALVDLAHQAAPLDRLAVMHTSSLDGAYRLLDVLADIRPPNETVIVEVTPVLGVHVGPNGLGLGVVRKL